MIKIISFSLWGNNPKYCVGAIKNAHLARQIYPGWVTRFYCAQSVPEDTTIPILQHGHGWKPDDTYRHIWRSHDDLTEIYFVKGDGDWRLMMNRFLPIADPEVEVMISRDCDSRLTSREASAVNAWIDSKYGFHTMHDHYHHSVPILGGMFGIKRGVMDDIGTLGVEWGNCNESRWQVDQDFLTQRVWPIVKHDCLNHAEFHTNVWPGVPIPLSRQGREFIGASYDASDVIDAEQVRHLYG
jgi:hypothetical protein